MKTITLVRRTAVYQKAYGLLCGPVTHLTTGTEITVGQAENSASLKWNKKAHPFFDGDCTYFVLEEDIANARINNAKT